jgi:hypothetical protein
MDVISIKVAAQQITDAATAILALQCVGDNSVCKALLDMYEGRIKARLEVISDEIKSVA